MGSFFLIAALWQILGATPYLILLLLFPSAGEIWRFTALTFSFVFLIIGLYLAVTLIHRRKFVTLITPTLLVSWKRIFESFAVWFVLVAIVSIVDVLIRPDFYTLSFNPVPWFLFTLVSLVFVTIQSFSEELLFRGYLLQALGLLTRNKVLLLLISGILFAVPHFLNPEMQSDFALMALYYFATGVFFTALVLKDNRLELALGAHAANNLFSVSLINYEGSVLETPAILIANAIDPVSNLMSFIAAAGLAYLWFFVIRKPKQQVVDTYQ
ncbi:MAG: CPBP family intramembrane metalloprotease [Chloroflexi bacterium]|nr:MAG: CPBP family intramembrane metalloprotease [Chloroflexota bacterium]